MGALALRPADLQEYGGEARVRDVRLGEVLGMAQPLNIRLVIEKNADELGEHGEVFTRRVKTSSVGGRPSTEFHLNEAQALLICMFSRAPNAAAARTQIIKVYMAYRQGQLVSADRRDPWTAMMRRIEQLEKLVGSQQMVETPDYAMAVTYAPSVFRLERADGSLRRQRYAAFWHDVEVRQTVIALHRQMTIDQARRVLCAEFGTARTPSRSALGRVWKQLDLTRAAAGRLN